MITVSQPDEEASNSSQGAIAEAACRVRGLLQACDECEIEEVKSFTSSQLGRFNLWSSNIGVFTARHASLDYRLRTAPTVKVAVLGNLEILCRQILEVLKGGENVVDEDLDELSEKPLRDLRGWVKGITRQYAQGHTAQSEALASIATTITTLHRLSLSIRKASERNSLGKARMLIDRDEAYEVIRSRNASRLISTTVRDVQYDITNEFENFVLHVLRTRWMSGQEGSASISSLDDPRHAFLKRCVQAISTRRREFAYFESHRDKLSREVTFSNQSPKPEDLATPAVTPQVAFTKALPDPVTVRNNLVPSETVPSEFHFASFAPANPENQVVPLRRAPSSTVSSEGGVLRDTGWFKLPPPPILEPSETEKMCPYCTLVLPHQTFQKDKMAKKWRHHLLEDLKPYVCLHRNCSLGSNALRTFSNWQKHIEVPHDDLWICPLHPNHGELHSTSGPCYSTPKKFRDHLNMDHSSLDDSEVKRLLRVSSVTADLSDECLVCSEKIISKENFQTHAARHLEAAFVLALPWRDDFDDGDFKSVGKNTSAAITSQETEPADEHTSDMGDSMPGAADFTAQLIAIENESQTKHSDFLQNWTETVNETDILPMNVPTVDSGTAAQLAGDLYTTVQKDTRSKPFERIPNPFRQFRDWVGHNLVAGLTSEGISKPYVPHTAQFEYWSSRKIEEILLSRNTIIASTQDISFYICILSILTYIEEDDIRGLDYLHEATRRNYDDASLPWTESGQNRIFGDTTVGQLVLQKFIEVQWMFYPIPTQPFLFAQPTMPSRAFMPNGQARFMNNRPVDRRQIFPITKRPESTHNVRRTGRSFTVSYMDVHVLPQQQGEGSILPVTVVFKSYSPEREQAYNNERNAYAAMRKAKYTKNILQCLGSFNYKDPDGQQYSTIISERADLTLRDIFMDNQMPYKMDHIRAIWVAFLGSLNGLAAFHEQKNPHGYLCVHQDLKPSNIFVFRSGDKEKPFTYEFKIGNFGSSPALSSEAIFHTQTSPDRKASQTYGPPEMFFDDTLSSSMDFTFDMWAIGCIMIELAVWITRGRLGLDEFRDQRIQDNESLMERENLERVDCFHDGVQVLKCVKQVVQAVREFRRDHDTLTSEMVNLALEFVLVPRDERFAAKQLIPRVQRVMKQEVTNDSFLDRLVIRDTVTQSPEPISTSALNITGSAEQTSLLSPSLEEVTTPALVPLKQPEESSVLGPIFSSFPPVTITELREWIQGCKGGIKRGLPGLESAKSLLDGRDFVLLLDNSRHTRKYREDMKSSVTALTYLLKVIDRDGIEVAHTSAPYNREKIKTQTQMSQFVERNFSGEIGVDCMIEHALDAILEPIKSKWSPPRSRFSLPTLSSRNQGSRGVTILVFTNGVWDHSAGGTCGAERPILRLVDSMRAHQVPRTLVSIQFVQLGSEERGIRRLRILDDKLSKDFDIVDTNPITASVWKILIGSMHSVND